MSAARPALALLALAALLAAARAQNSYCSQTQYGVTEGTPVSVPEAVLPAGSSNVKFEVPPGACAGRGKAVGVEVTACDNNTPPTVQFYSLQNGVVVRTSYNQNGQLSLTVYCA